MTPGFWRVEPWQVLYLCEIGSKAWLIHIAVASLSFFAQGDVGALAQFWLIGMVVLSLAITGLCHYGLRCPSGDDRKLIAIGWTHSVLTALIALLWAFGAFQAATHSFDNLLLYSLVLGGTALGAVSSQHSALRSCYASIWISLIGLAGAHMLHSPDEFGPINAAMIVLYAVALSILARKMNHFLVSNRMLTENLDLQLAELSREHQRTEEANQAKTRFLAHASHDLRQPVHAIGMLTTILRQYPLDDEVKQLVDRIDTSLGSLSGLFKSLLDISAVDLGRITPKSEIFDLGALLDQIAIQNMPLIEERGGTMRLVSTRHWVQTDPRILSNILQNLISNAAKYAPGCPVLLGVKRRGDQLSIIVADAGPGIAGSEQALVFQEFYRSADKTGSATQGLGLGLPLVARYAPLLGLGHRLQSRVGKGTLIEISGLRPARREKAVRVVRTAFTNRLSGLWVHAIDDDPEILQAMIPLLESWGCRVTSGNGVPKNATDIDMIITDYDMGDGITGIDYIKKIRQHAGFAIPTLIVTGVAELDNKAIQTLEAVHVLAKPARPAQLRAGLMSLTLQRQTAAKAP